MGKTIKISLLFMTLLLFITACGNSSSNEDNNEKSVGKNENEKITTTIIGGRTGGAWSVFTEGIAESIRRENNGALVTVEPGSIIENPLIVGTGKVPYGVSYSMTAHAAFAGEEPYTEAYEDIRAVSVVIPANYYQFLVRESLEFDSIKEMIDSKYPLRLAIDQQGSAGEIITREVLNYYGVTYDDIKSWGGSADYLSGSKAFELMSDSRMDATGDAESAPSGNIIEAATTTNLKMLPLEQDVIKAVVEELSMDANTISSSAYDFMDKDINTVSTPAILIVHKDVDEEEVYAVVKSIYNSFSYLGNVHEEFKDLTEENMAKIGGVPLHPGAERFFKETGILD